MVRTLPNELGPTDEPGNRYKVDCGVAANVNATLGAHVYLNDDDAWALVGTAFDGSKMTGIMAESVNNAGINATSRPARVMLIGRFVGKVDAAVQEGTLMKRSDAVAGQFEAAVVATDAFFICNCYAETVGGTNAKALMFKFR